MSLLRLGTRCSPLSLVQAGLTETFLRERMQAPSAEFILVKISASGDRILDKPLYDIGGKGLFTKEIDQALLDKRIDIAVHSAKDMESELPDGLVVACYLPRADRRDCVISAHNKNSADDNGRDDGHAMDLLRLPLNSRIGTSSPRRAKLLSLVRDDFVIGLLRGNIERRLSSLTNGENDAVILASCALDRLDIKLASHRLAEDFFLSAAGQGAIALVVREREDDLRRTLLTASDATCHTEVTAERAFLREVGGSCHSALGASAHLSLPFARETGECSAREQGGGLSEQQELSLSAFLIEDGKKRQETITETIETPRDDPLQGLAFACERAQGLGIKLAKRLKKSV